MCGCLSVSEKACNVCQFCKKKPHKSEAKRKITQVEFYLIKTIKYNFFQIKCYSIYIICGNICYCTAVE